MDSTSKPLETPRVGLKKRTVRRRKEAPQPAYSEEAQTANHTKPAQYVSSPLPEIHGLDAVCLRSRKCPSNFVTDARSFT